MPGCHVRDKEAVITKAVKDSTGNHAFRFYHEYFRCDFECIGHGSTIPLVIYRRALPLRAVTTNSLMHPIKYSLVDDANFIDYHWL